ncbi:MAG: hypothetical protein ACRD12_02595, partial [Acidimicrobiales bacterium]
ALLSAGVRAADGGGPIDVASAGGTAGEPTTTLATIPGVPFPLPPPAPTTTEPGAVPTTFVIPPPTWPSTTTPATTVPPATVPPGGTNTTTAALALCPREVVAYSVTTDKSNYETGEQVRATATVRNTGASPCYGTSAQLVSFEEAGGRLLMGIGGHYDCFEPRPCGPVLAPGQTQSITQCWDQRAETGQVPPGTYAVTFSLDQYTSRVAFQINAPPAGPTTTRPPGTSIACS